MFPGTKRPSPCRVSTRGRSGVPAQHAQSCARSQTYQRNPWWEEQALSCIHTPQSQAGPCLLSLNNARSIPRDKSLDNRWLFMTTRLSKFGASDKSLANLPVTQLLALVPRDCREESSKMGKTFFNHEQKAASTLALGSAGSHTGPRWRVHTVEAFESNSRKLGSQASGLWK